MRTVTDGLRGFSRERGNEWKERKMGEEERRRIR